MSFNSSANLFSVAFIIAASCASYGTPVQHLVDAEAAVRRAHESSAAAPPSAQLHLRLAEEAVATAKRLVDEGDYRRADYVLVRARSDADLAVAEEREAQAEAAARQARGALNEIEAQGTQTPSSPATATLERGGVR